MTSSSSSSSIYINICDKSYADFKALAAMTDDSQRKASIAKGARTLNFDQARITDSGFVDEIKTIVKMSFIEEMVAVFMFTFGVPGAVFTLPIGIILLGSLCGCIQRVALLAFIFLAPLAVMPVTFKDGNLSSWMCYLILRYFSFRCVTKEFIEPNRPTILVAPPHGVFPFGNIITMIAFPSICGFSFKGLASSAALKTPIFRQLLGAIGVIDADSTTALKALNENKTIGISTGGVAEVFETNSDPNTETIVLQSRKGFVKLALKSGADIVPCYLFGNTEMFSLWTGGSFAHKTLRKISRAIGFALIIFWGRFGLPVPYRIPVLGVMGKPIRIAEKIANPTQEQIDEVHKMTIEQMYTLFEEHKHLYGWGHKKLVIL